MTDPLEAWQAGMTAALEASAGVRAAMELPNARVFDVAPTNASYPHIMVGEDQVFPVPGDGLEVHEISATIHVWDRPEVRGLSRAKAIARAVIETLSPGFAVDGFDVDDIQVAANQCGLDPERQLAHAEITLRTLLEPV